MAIVYYKFTDEVDEQSVTDLIDCLDEHRDDEVRVIWDSSGGNHEWSLKGYNAIVAHGNVVGIIYRASSGCLTMACGCKISCCCEDGDGLAHEPHIRFDGGEKADAKALEKYRKICETAGQEVRDIIKRKTGLAMSLVDKIVALGARLNAQQLKGFRIVDHVFSGSIPRSIPRPMARRMSMDGFDMFASFTRCPRGARKAFDDANARYAARQRSYQPVAAALAPPRPSSIEDTDAWRGAAALARHYTRERDLAEARGDNDYYYFCDHAVRGAVNRLAAIVPRIKRVPSTRIHPKYAGQY